MRRACIRSAKNRASVVLPTRSGPSMAMYRGGSNAGALARRLSGVRGMARDYSRKLGRHCPHKLNGYDGCCASVCDGNSRNSVSHYIDTLRVLMRESAHGGGG